MTHFPREVLQKVKIIHDFSNRRRPVFFLSTRKEFLRQIKLGTCDDLAKCISFNNHIIN